MPDADFEFVEPFGVDHGELDGLSLAMAFALGVEWQMIAGLADADDGFERPIHASNRDRIEALLARRNRERTITYMHDDVSEGWLWLSVAPMV